jgi:hypothetical protein
MKHKSILIFGLILVAVILMACAGTRPIQAFISTTSSASSSPTPAVETTPYPFFKEEQFDAVKPLPLNTARPTPEEATPIVFDKDQQAVQEVILRAKRVQIEAEYTFETNQLASVFINDPRAGHIEISADYLDRMRVTLQKPDLQMEQVGVLDTMTMHILTLKHNYDAYMDDLRAKQAAGTLSAEEQTILQQETYGWPTPVPQVQQPTAAAAEICVTAQANQEMMCFPGPTPVPPASYPFWPRPKFRGLNPALLPEKSFQVNIISIEINGDIALVEINSADDASVT